MRRLGYALLLLGSGLSPAWADCTWGSVAANIVLSNGNKTWASNSASQTSGIGTVGYLAGTGSTNASFLKYYETTIVATGSNGPGVGITNENQNFNQVLGSGIGNSGISLQSNGATLYLNANGTPAFTFANTNVIGMAVDFANQKIWWTKNGTTRNADIIANQNPATNTGGFHANPSASGTPFGQSGSYHTIYPAFGSLASGNSATINANGPFAYTLPSGYTGWCVTSAPPANFMKVVP